MKIIKVKDRLDKLKQDNYRVIHILYPEGVQMDKYDWIRIYESKHKGCIDRMIYSLDVKDIDRLPQHILEIEYDREDLWFIGTELSLDLVINIK